MAKVESVFKLRGSVGDLTFRETEDGTVAQCKPGPNREKVLTHENFERTRRNAGEFKLVIQGATLLRRGLGSALQGVNSSSLSGRMNGLLFAATLQDGEHDLGFRRASCGDVSQLAGFDFNRSLPLAVALPVKFTHSLDVATGTLHVAFPSFIARRKKVFPEGASHFRIVSCGAVLNFTNQVYVNHIKRSELLPLSRKTPGPICLEHLLSASPGDVLVQAMGMEFYKVVNGQEVLMKGGALRILEAAQVEEAQDAGSQ